MIACVSLLTSETAQAQVPNRATMILRGGPASGVSVTAQLNLTSQLGPSSGRYNYQFVWTGGTRFRCQMELNVSGQIVSGQFNSCLDIDHNVFNPTECNFYLRKNGNSATGKGFCNYYNTGDNFYSATLYLN